MLRVNLRVGHPAYYILFIINYSGYFRFDELRRQLIYRTMRINNIIIVARGYTETNSVYSTVSDPTVSGQNVFSPFGDRATSSLNGYTRSLTLGSIIFGDSNIVSKSIYPYG